MTARRPTDVPAPQDLLDLLHQAEEAANRHRVAHYLVLRRGRSGHPEVVVSSCPLGPGRYLERVSPGPPGG